MKNLKALLEAELVEMYNRRENLRIFALPEETPQTIDGKRVSKSYDQLIKKIVTLAGGRSPAVDKNDISIAYRLRSKSNGHRPVIFRFSRRFAKVDLLQKNSGGEITV